jgi:hypothetical protein
MSVDRHRDMAAIKQESARPSWSSVLPLGRIHHVSPHHQISGPHLDGGGRWQTGVKDQQTDWWSGFIIGSNGD